MLTYLMFLIFFSEKINLTLLYFIFLRFNVNSFNMIKSSLQEFSNTMLFVLRCEKLKQINSLKSLKKCVLPKF